MWALRAWSMISTGTSSLCAKFHNRFKTLWAITPSLSSSAKRLMSSNSFSRCFLLALVQLACRGDTKQDFKWTFYEKLVFNHPSLKWLNYIMNKNETQMSPILSKTELGYPFLTLKQSNRWSSCSGEKSQASFASRSCTFFTIASCLPA